MKSKLKIGIIGLGEHILRAHVAHLVKMPEVEIIGWYDPDMKKLELPKVKEYGLQDKYFESEKEVFEHPLIDAIFIGSPDKYHLDQLFMAVSNGKHVFCEKPMIVEWGPEPSDPGILSMLLDTAKGRDLIISSCHPRRYDPPIIWLKNQLSSPGFVEETFGEITDFTFEFHYHKVTEDWKMDRSLMLDHFGHEIDLYRFLFGNTIQWQAKLLFDTYMQYHVSGKGEDGAPNFEFIGNRTLDEEVYRESIFIRSSKTTWILQLNDGVGYDTATGRAFFFPKKDYEVMFPAVNQNFVDAILKGTPSYLTHDDMLVNNVTGVMLKGNNKIRSDEYLFWTQ